MEAADALSSLLSHSDLRAPDAAAFHTLLVGLDQSLFPEFMDLLDKGSPFFDAFALNLQLPAPHAALAAAPPPLGSHCKPAILCVLGFAQSVAKADAIHDQGLRRDIAIAAYLRALDGESGSGAILRKMSEDLWGSAHNNVGNLHVSEHWAHTPWGLGVKVPVWRECEV